MRFAENHIRISLRFMINMTEPIDEVYLQLLEADIKLGYKQKGRHVTRLIDEIRRLRTELVLAHQNLHASCWLVDGYGVKTIYAWACQDCKDVWSNE